MPISKLMEATMHNTLRRKTILITIVLSIGLFSACREIKVTTQVFPDGSCERIVSVNSDSSSAIHCIMPIPHNSTWEIEQKEGKDNKQVYNAKKKFARVRDLNAEFVAANDTILMVNCPAVFQKRFRWFFSYLSYRETYKAYNPFKLVPVSDYLTAEEIQRYGTGKDSSDVEKEKIEEWQKQTIFAEFFGILQQGAQTLNDPKLTVENVESNRDTLFAILVEAFTNSNATMDTAITICEKLFQANSVWQLRSRFNRIQRMIDFMTEGYTDSYASSVIMPGLILGTNAKKIEGNQVTWEIKAEEFFIKDYEMWVESRIVNKWAIWATGVVLLLSSIVLIMPALRRRNV